MTKETELPDVFLWANKTDGRKDKLGIELFAITKSSEIFRIDHNEAINHQLFALFLYDIISGVQVDSITGVRVVDYAASEGCQNTLPAIKVNDVPVAEAIMEYLEYTNDIDLLDLNQIEAKKLLAICARFTDKETSESFYIFKHIRPASVLVGGAVSYAISAGRMEELSSECALKIDPSNQVLVFEDTMFVFNKSKFESMFQYDPVSVAEARKNGKILDERLSIATPTVGQGIEFLCKDNRTLVKRLAKLNPVNMTRDVVEEIIRDYNVDLMTDATNDKLIIMDANDAKKLLDIVEDNFVRGTNGTAYIAKNKKELELKEDK